MGKKNATNWTSKVGLRFGCVLVLAEVGVEPKRQETLYQVQCDCGTKVVMRSGRLKKKTTCGTGCVKRGAAPFAPKKARLFSKFSYYKRGAKKRQKSFELTLDEFEKLIDGECVYCGHAPAGGVDRVDSNKGYAADNCASCCTTCNLAKLDTTAEEFKDWIKRVYSHLCSSRAFVQTKS